MFRRKSLKAYKRDPSYSCTLLNFAWLTPFASSSNLRYADILSRGGVLEPEGTVEIKFRSRELIKAMRRLDPEVKSLAEKLGDPSLDAKTKNELETQLLAREQSLLPIYTQVCAVARQGTIAAAHLHPSLCCCCNCRQGTVAAARLQFYTQVQVAV